MHGQQTIKICTKLLIPLARKIYYTVTVCTTVFLKMNRRVRNM